MADRKIVQNRAKPARPAKPIAAKAPIVAQAALPVKPPMAVQPPVAATAETPAASAPILPALAAEFPQPAIAAPIVDAPVAPPVAAEAKIEAETKTIDSGASTMTETITNTVNKAQEATTQATEQFRGAMSQANEQGKAAMEKSARVVEEMAELTRGNMEAMVASQKTAAKYVETLTQGAADYGRKSFEEASATMKSFAEAKSPADIFRLQSDFARSAFDSWIGESARVSETVVKMSNDVAEPLASRYAVAAERIKTVAA